MLVASCAIIGVRPVHLPSSNLARPLGKADEVAADMLLHVPCDRDEGIDLVRPQFLTVITSSQFLKILRLPQCHLQGSPYRHILSRENGPAFMISLP